MSRTVPFGDRIVSLSPLRLGQMKKAKAELEALLAMGSLRLDSSIPSEAQVDAMTTVVFLSASAADPTLTREDFGALVDELPFDVGLKALAEGLTIVMGRQGVAPPGEAASPATDASTSSGSTE